MTRFLPLAIAAALVSAVSAQAPNATPAQQAEVFYRQGMAAEKAGDASAAKQGYENALQANPRHANARYRLGQLKTNYASIAAKGREAKFGAVVVPVYKIDEATLQEALDALRILVEKESKDKVTVNFIVQDPKNTFANAKVSLVLKNTPASGILKYLMQQVGGKVRYDEYAIAIMPR